jgi:hypothetical protein
MWVSLFYVFAYASTVTTLLPFAVGWRRWSAMPAARRWMTGYLGLEFVVEAVSYALGKLHVHNLWLLGYSLPVETALLIRVLAEWQVDERSRRAARWLSGLCLLFMIPTVLSLEPTDNFSTYRESAQGILCLAVAAYTVVRRSLEGPDGAARQDWFWISAGIMLYFGAYGLLNPLARILLRGNSLGLLYAVFAVRGMLQTVTNLLYLIGMRCQTTPLTSGLSLSPPLSWPQSSSSPLPPR